MFIDAPLSLPGVYKGLVGYEDYFFRKADKALKAMSPMFLGGLTARAMRLQAYLRDFNFYETYPSAQANRLALKSLDYKKSLKQIPSVINSIAQQYPELNLEIELNNWHEVDAILALIGAYRFEKKTYITYGTLEEGLIYI